MRTEDTHLVWTDDEVQLLLETTNFIAKKTCAGVDWQSRNEKYEDIRETFVKSTQTGRQ